MSITVDFNYSDRIPFSKIIEMNRDSIIFSLGPKNKKLGDMDIVKLMSEVIFFNNYPAKIVNIELIKDYLITQIRCFYVFTYNPITFKTTSKNLNETKFNLYYNPNDSNINKLIENNKIIISYMNEIKNIIEMPPNLVYPETLLKYILDFSERNSLEVLDIYDDKRLEIEGFNGILSVGRGSHNKPRMAIIEYNGSNKDSEPIVLIGKGVTYDSGGYSIKTRTMKNMKRDKTGVCIVLGIMGALAALGINKRVIGIFPLAENVISSSSYKPDEVIKSYSGKTVEIFNTDAEGRLLLMDCLTLAYKYNPRFIIDIATLTDVSIFCDKLGAIFSNNMDIAWKLQKISNSIGDNFWVLPILDSYLEDTRDTKMANVKNEGYTCNSSTITGAAFLKNFISEEIPWIHMDLGDSYNNFEIYNKKNLNSSNGFLSIFEFICRY
jgi:leucyl aminopeptidase